MNTHIIKAVILGFTILISCQDSTKNQTKTPSNHTNSKVTDTLIMETFTDKNGQTLELSFNNNKNIVTISLNGETAILQAENAASGFWYKNEQYELRGKGTNIDLKKHDQLIFTHVDSMVTATITNKQGQTLNMVFNNTSNTAKVYLDGGDEIQLNGQTPGSGIWYKNEEYELRGKGEHLELTKNDSVVFKN
ncbi:MliC family protein [Bizionia sediminis]|uniref:MliC family protein n=1 Tax=Bizionia sediminis TaxID=1737064 RepID=A0ABW5KTR6_9FLAO